MLLELVMLTYPLQLLKNFSEKLDQNSVPEATASSTQQYHSSLNYFRKKTKQKNWTKQVSKATAYYLALAPPLLLPQPRQVQAFTQLCIY